MPNATLPDLKRGPRVQTPASYRSACRRTHQPQCAEALMALAEGGDHDFAPRWSNQLDHGVDKVDQQECTNMAREGAGAHFGPKSRPQMRTIP